VHETTTQPYPVSGKVYDIDGTAEGGVTVRLTNTRTKETLTATTNTSGEYVLDLSNLESGWNNNDVVFLQAWEKSSPFKTASYTFEVSGDNYNKDLYLQPIFNKRVKTEDLKEIQLREFSDVESSKRTVSPRADKLMLTYDSDSNLIRVVKYSDGVKSELELGYDSDGNLTSVEKVV